MVHTVSRPKELRRTEFTIFDKETGNVIKRGNVVVNISDFNWELKKQEQLAREYNVDVWDVGIGLGKLEKV